MASQQDNDATSIAAQVDRLQSAGRYAFTRDDLQDAADRSAVAVDAALRRLKQAGRIHSPRRGFFVVVPLEYRSAGCPPPSWFLADLMGWLEQPYYVGLLTAAALHGAGHQQPMRFQVVTDRATRPMPAGRTRLEFHRSRSIDSTPTTKLQTETGTMRVATPEATAFDLVRYQSAAGHLDNVATVLSELAERLHADQLVACARTQAPPDVQRVGYLLDRLGEHALAESLLESLADCRVRPVLLVPKRARGRHAPDGRWRVVPNQDLELDL